jgi:hypothetical protein
MARKSQSAMEYLTTYGWAIVAIGVGIGVLYSLGVFGVGANSPTGCSVIAGFSCSKPVLFSSGVLNMGLGQIGNIKTITATGCSSNSTAPTVWESTNITLQSGQVHNFTFQCPIIQGSKIGSLYKGTLWIEYSTSGQPSSVTQQVGAVQISIQSSGVPGTPTNSIGYASVTLSNQQSSSTGSNFQEMVTVPSSFAPYESSDLGNIRFYQGGQELYSWCESGCSAGSSAVFWVNLPSGIASNSNLQILMVFEANSIEYDGAYAGESPQLSSSYAKYDNGGRVFGNYQNFLGTSCPAGWTCSNPLNHAGMFSNDLVLGSLGGIWAEPNTFTFSSPAIAEFYGSMNWGGSGSSGVAGPGMVMYSNDQYGNSVVTGESWFSGTLGTTLTPGVSQGTFTAFSSQPTINQNYVWSYIATGASAISQYGYQSGSQATVSYPYVGSYAELTLQDSAISPPAALTAYWIRTRAYPPGGVMPSATFGGVATS